MIGFRMALATALALAPPGMASAKTGMSPALSSRPLAGSRTILAAGKTLLPDGAVVYVPATTGAGRTPLLVLLHGAGGRGARFIDQFTDFADREGVALLAVQAHGPTWDLAPKRALLGGPLAMKGRPQIGFGDDVSRVDSALASLFAKAAIDPKRITLLGFSDGASYALSLGLANPQLFSAIVALSPGFVVIPPLLAPAQRIFIAHGRQDRVLPFAVARHDITGLLIENGLKPRFEPFEGDHRIDKDALRDGLSYAFRATPAGDVPLNLQR
jgi:predicted esterase